MNRVKKQHILPDVPLVWADVYGMPVAVRMAYLREVKKTK